MDFPGEGIEVSPSLISGSSGISFKSKCNHSAISNSATLRGDAIILLNMLQHEIADKQPRIHAMRPFWIKNQQRHIG